MAFIDRCIMEDNNFFEDFTEAHYRQLLQLMRENYHPICYQNYKTNGKNVLWRHDVDYSVHRAYKLAQIEAEEGVQATYFIWIHSPYYNIFEEEIYRLIKKIADLGHNLGLHFDYSFYNQHAETKGIDDQLEYEKKILESLVGISIYAFSFHNPSSEVLRLYTSECYCDMVNTYSTYLQTHYEYCSDSNGYWRFKRLEDVLRSADAEKLQVLTHPGWWTPEVMSPRDRVSRLIDGRARKNHEQYDCILEEMGRLNIR